MSRQYESMRDAIQREIIEPIENGSLVLGHGAAAEYDINAIAEAVLEGRTDENGRYYIAPKEDVDFWAAVESAAYYLDGSAKESVDGAWKGEGWYQIAYSDSGQKYDARWYEQEDQLVADFIGAYSSASEFHLPYCDYLGDGDEPDYGLDLNAEMADMREVSGSVDDRADAPQKDNGR